MEGSARVSNSPIPLFLNGDNYQAWRSCMKTYLMAEDLWEVIEAIRDVEEDDKAWKRKNAKALSAIQNSCGPEIFHFVCQTEIAKFAWETLQQVSMHKAHVEKSTENYEPYIEFIEFVEKGDWDNAKECLKIKELHLYSAVTAVDPRDAFGESAIHVAAGKGHVNIVKQLMVIMTHEDLKMVNAYGNTALHLASAEGQLHVVKQLVFLMEKEVNHNGDTALNLAVCYEKVDIVRELVSSMRVTNLKMKNNEGYTPLHQAVINRSVAMVKILTPLMGEVTDPYGDTALHIAVKLGDTNLVKELVLLMKEDSVSIQNDQGYTALHLALKYGNVPIVKAFIPKEKERDFSSSYIQFINFVIVGEWDNAKGCYTELDDLCDAITVVDRRDEYGDTALHVAAREGHVEVVKEMILCLQVRQDKLELNTEEDIRGFGDCIESDVTEHVIMKKATYMVDHYEKLLSTVLEVQNALGSTALHLALWHEKWNVVKELAPRMTQRGSEIQDDEGFTPLLLAILKGRMDIVKELLPMMSQTGLELKTTKNGMNALHRAIMTKKMDIAKEVMGYMRKEALEEKDGAGYTALGCVLEVSKDDEEVMEIAKYMAESNPKVLGISVPPFNWIPTVWALVKVRWNLGLKLYTITPLEYLMPDYGRHGSQLIIECLRANKFDIIMHLLGRCSKIDILLGPTAERWPPIMELARMSNAFPSGTQLGFWESFIYNRLCIEPEDLSTFHSSIDILQEDSDVDNQIHLFRTVTKKMVYRLLKLVGVVRLREMKSNHTRIIEVIRCISEMLKKEPPTEAQLDIIRKSTFKAVEHGNVDFITRICEAIPSLAIKKSSDEDYKNIFHYAVECRRHEIFSLIYRLDEEDLKSNKLILTKYPGHILHLAGILSPLSRFNSIHGAALQMQRELQWFKAVEDIVSPILHDVLNSDGVTAREIFTKNHETLKKEAEDSMKGTATSCTVVGALIVTMMFAAAFTFPGGNSGDTGYPIFLNKNIFLVFIISDIVSLVSSTTSVITFLGILTSRYAEDDFLKNLPKKMMVGLFTLFISIVTMMIAFSTAIIVMLQKEYSWVVAPTIVVASIPAASYIWLQFPLLIETFWSTYGPGVFDKKLNKGQPWIKISS